MKTALCLVAAAVLATAAAPAANATDAPFATGFIITWNSFATPTGSMYIDPAGTTSCTRTLWSTVTRTDDVAITSLPQDNNGTDLSKANQYSGKMYFPRMVSPGGYVTDIYTGTLFWDTCHLDWQFVFVLPAGKQTVNGIVVAPN